MNTYLPGSAGLETGWESACLGRGDAGAEAGPGIHFQRCGGGGTQDAGCGVPENSVDREPTHLSS